MARQICLSGSLVRSAWFRAVLSGHLPGRPAEQYAEQVQTHAARNCGLSFNAGVTMPLKRLIQAGISASAAF